MNKMMTREEAIRYYDYINRTEDYGSKQAMAARIAFAALTTLNEPLTCAGCLWAEMGALVKCSSCMRDKKDNYYRRQTKGEER